MLSTLIIVFIDMDWRLLVQAVCIGSLAISSSVVLVPNVRVSSEQSSTQRSAKHLQHLAQSMTVKVLSKEAWGVSYHVRLNTCSKD